MLRVAKSLSIPNVRLGGILSPLTQCSKNYSEDKGSEPPIVPLQLSYNSYEDLSRDGNTPPVIIMHGLFGSKQNWRSISKAIHSKTNPTRKVIAVDARNHGESPHSPNHRYIDLAEDIRLFLEEHKIPKAVVIGHSMGGRAMMVFSLKYPHLVEKAIIVDVSPVTTSPALKNMGEVFSAMRRVSLPSDIGLPQARVMADEQMKEFIPDKVTRSFILSNLHRAVNGVIQWRSNVDSLDDNFVKHIARFLGPKQRFLLKQYTAPILFVGGLRSDYLTYGWRANPDALGKHYWSHLTTFPDHVKQNLFAGPILLLAGTESHCVKEGQLVEIRNYFPNVQLKTLEGGHNIGLVDSREEFLDQVSDFINISTSKENALNSHMA